MHLVLNKGTEDFGYASKALTIPYHEAVKNAESYALFILELNGVTIV